ncbi:hypothetical protein [Actinopolymorpha rutila]|uniref:Uncharacterized protein n=1 Tax=Actinopolymorpha rutila TaxID=446787 RepID=A0A852ZKE7_9ACTN|nr:hypothetical protein [Actinopolymorpha rutila]NYH88836.1 hypothetical protein [Actinopolymorpha rutila]
MLEEAREPAAGPAGVAGVAALVREFHEAFGLGAADTPVPRPDSWRLRIALLREEFEEYVDAAEPVTWSRWPTRWPTWRT